MFNTELGLPQKLTLLEDEGVGPYLYRVCRPDENPRRQLQPKAGAPDDNFGIMWSHGPVLVTTTGTSVTPLAIDAVENGSRQGFFSPFIHASADARRVYEKYLNQPGAWLCRIDCSVLARQYKGMWEGLDFLDLSTPAKFSRWASYHVCPRAFNFAVSDKEVLLACAVPPAAVKRMDTSNLPVYRPLTSTPNRAASSDESE
mmetsp:Transcript_57623/g.132318  ORF Transcript_57623/g.132318 Transcript_57623/m.132318 type:complete len:201 (-) Transcript_57623:343-945(-)|eukprot:CAMPEP_0119354130 /NCGR_PEP_ID=MMETSP1334-20130426/3184_1 /TAXON_ID=127549 /ORGANISM="Calcidiscus leptoporus, Strain RCC1130" /LENGTH=200 /DNA_ID=CAMNT_0007367603 /DNA_START=76 /DNA_END=678 /DNA_ORIENTATION=+